MYVVSCLVVPCRISVAELKNFDLRWETEVYQTWSTTVVVWDEQCSWLLSFKRGQIIMPVGSRQTTSRYIQSLNVSTHHDSEGTSDGRRRIAGGRRRGVTYRIKCSGGNIQTTEPATQRHTDPSHSTKAVVRVLRMWMNSCSKKYPSVDVSIISFTDRLYRNLASKDVATKFFRAWSTSLSVYTSIIVDSWIRTRELYCKREIVTSQCSRRMFAYRHTPRTCVVELSTLVGSTERYIFCSSCKHCMGTDFSDCNKCKWTLSERTPVYSGPAPARQLKLLTYVLCILYSFTWCRLPDVQLCNLTLFEELHAITDRAHKRPIDDRRDCKWWRRLWSAGFYFSSLFV